MLKKTVLLFIGITFSLVCLAQKRALDHSDYKQWKTIEEAKLSNDGAWVSYVLETGEGQSDDTLVIYNASQAQEIRFARAKEVHFSADNRYAVFRVKPPLDTLQAMRRRKVKKEKLPGDTLAIYDLKTKQIEKIPDLESYQLPENWAGWLAYQYKNVEADSTEKKGDKKEKKKSKDEVANLVLRHLGTANQKEFAGVTHYTHAKDQACFLFSTNELDSTTNAGVYYFDAQKEATYTLLEAEKGTFKQLRLGDNGQQAAFIADLDTTKVRIRPFSLYHWQLGANKANKVVGQGDTFLKKDWILSEHFKLNFSEDGSKLYFGVAPPPILQDTSLLEEEIVNVEVWHYEDARLHTQQKVQLESDQKKSFLAVYYPKTGERFQIGNRELPDIQLTEARNVDYALGYNEEVLQKEMSWEGYPICKEVYWIDLKAKMVHDFPDLKKVCGNPEMSPDGNYIYWYNAPDSVWFAHSLKLKKLVQLTDNQSVPFYDELNDRPMYPGSYGIAGWLEKDAYVLINDRYDVWKVDPSGKNKKVNLTNGRAQNKRYRYVDVNPDVHPIDGSKPVLLHTFNEATKQSGYAWLDVEKATVRQIVEEDFSYTSRPKKAKQADKWLFTKESFQKFPDLQYGSSLADAKQISEANPQQKDFYWGTIEPYQWTSLDGQELNGLLIKPENFDPGKQYPMLTYFYERSSHNLHRHWRPYPGRSIINFSFYASRGYVIFIPDIPYREGYPGESAYNAIIPGVTSLINQGYIDKDRLGVQGHSWGGYQVAYLITKTDIFKCAESGAPVVNMFSAYGGIRWGSGLSRMFQYEKTQSRIGGTIWEYPIRYMENSPLFFLDKVNTPVLIMHNDNDGAVPWYQGIEFFVGMRRLGKPAWMLNYNGEPHWPVKLQNRQDFQKRMQQFFDHYLMGTPKPQWMERGVPAIEKGILQGYELKKP